MFLNAVMLAGLSAAVIPIVLHLINRARFRRIEWGAMLFLETNRPHLIDRSRMTGYGLLFLRVAGLGIIATALARPVFWSDAISPSGASVAMVIVLDRSASMTHPEYGSSRFELARRMALNLIGQLKKGDQAGVVSLGENEESDIPLTNDLQEVASQLASMQPGNGFADHAEGVRRAEKLIRSAASARAIIVLIGDRQASAWQNLALLKSELISNTRIVALPVGSTDNTNIWIESVDLVNPPAIVGQETRFSVRIRNDTSKARSDLPVTILLDDQVLAQQKVGLLPRTSRTVEIPVVLPKTGSALIRVRIESSGISQDDQFFFVSTVVDPIRVLSIRGNTIRSPLGPGMPLSTTNLDFFRLALSPFSASGEKKADAFRYRQVSDEPWPDWEDDREKVVILSDVQLNERRVRRLEQFVAAGGGLLIVAGSGTDVEAWNQWLFRNGDGLAPCFAEKFEWAGYQSLRPEQLSARKDLFPFAGKDLSEIGAIPVGQWMRFRPLQEQTVIMRLDGGDPILMHHRFGRGRVMIWAVPVDEMSSGLTTSPLFLPMMQSMVRWLSAGKIESRNLKQNQRIEQVYPSHRDRTVSVLRPDGRTERIPLVISNDRGIAIYLKTDLPGRYVLRTSGQSPVEYMVQPDRNESELNLMNDQELKSVLDQASIEMTSLENMAGRIGPSRDPTELSGLLLALAVIVLSMELVLGKWGSGFGRNA